jgi:predicted PurR-regulated permease PerM
MSATSHARERKHQSGATKSMNSDPTADPEMERFGTVENKIELEIPWRTILRILVTIGFLLLVIEIREVLFQIFLGFLLAAALFPLVWRLERWRMSRSLAVLTVIFGVLAVLVLIVALVVPPLVEQATDFWDDLPVHARDALSWLQPREPELYDRIIVWVDDQTADASVADVDVEQAVSGGATAFSFLAGAIAAIAVAAFTLTTGDQALRSLGRGLPPGQEDKVRRIVPEVTRVVSGYVRGQAINSTLFALFTFILFTALDLPSPVVAAVIAFVLDAVPLVGATVATAIFAILALTEGTTEAIVVVVTCLIYQQFENYVTSPRVFGRTLKISPFTSLVSVLIGGSLMGIPGVLLGPPTAALISAVIRVWAEDIEVVTGPSGPKLTETWTTDDDASPA